MELSPVTNRAHFPVLPTAWLRWTQNAAIFACCANLFSTALANLGFAAFLLLFLGLCISGERRWLNTQSFPSGVALAIGIYIGWQAVGLSYTDAPLSYGLKNLFSERKICYVLPLALIFSEPEPKRRFLVAFLTIASVGLTASFLISKLPIEIWTPLFWVDDKRVVPRLLAENQFVFRSNVTQGMVFAISAFLALWFSLEQSRPVRKWGLRALAAAFTLNIAWVTHGRSGYVVFLVLVVWAFAMWRGWRGVMTGMLVAGLLAGFAFYASPSVQNRVMSGVNEARTFATEPEETSLGKRMILYETTLELIKNKPVFGLGTGAFRKHYSELVAEKYHGWQSEPADDPHSQYLFVTVENGLIGLATFLLLIGALLGYCLKDRSPYGRMAAGCVIAWSVTSLFSGHFRTFPEGHLIAFIVGILMVNRPSGDSGKQLG